MNDNENTKVLSFLADKCNDLSLLKNYLDDGTIDENHKNIIELIYQKKILEFDLLNKSNIISRRIKV